MDKILKFLEENPLQYCATVGLDGKPKVRPFQMTFSDKDSPIYCTGARKEVYKELAANPHLEISVSTMTRWLRISGKAVWLDDKKMTQRIIEHSMLVRSIYKSAENEDLKVFYFADAIATLSDFSGKPPYTVKLN